MVLFTIVSNRPETVGRLLIEPEVLHVVHVTVEHGAIIRENNTGLKQSISTQSRCENNLIELTP